MVSVGLLKLDQTAPVPLERTKLPSSSRVAEEIPRLEVLESQTVAPDPLTRRRFPLERNWNEPPESTEAPLPADQIVSAPLEKTIAAMNEGGEVGGSTGTKPRENVLLGEAHVWLVFEA